MRRLLKNLPLALPSMLALVALGAVGLVTTSCNSSQAQVRFVHAITDAGPLDIDFNGTKELTDIGFFQFQPASGYTPVPSGSDTIEGLATGSTTEAFSVSNVNLNAGSQYTIVATGNIQTVSSVILLSPTDNNTEPADGQVSFRVIDASVSGPATIAVYILPNNSLGQGPGVTPTTAITMTVSSPQSSLTGTTSGYVSQSFNSLNTGYTMYVCVSGDFNPMFSAAIPNVGSVTVGSIRTVILTDNSEQTGINVQPIELTDLN
jgi:hypothetical protein